MSGAEAILGVISAGAGLLSLSIQLGESAVKLKAFCSRINTAPETVEQLVYDLETLGLTLQQLDHHRQDDRDSSALLARCIDRCREHAATIASTIEKMERHLTRNNRIGKLYIALKDPDIKALFNELQQAESSLQLAVFMYYKAEDVRRTEAQHNELLSQGAAHAGALRKLEDVLQDNNAQVIQRIESMLQLQQGLPMSTKCQYLIPATLNSWRQDALVDRKRGESAHRQARMSNPSWVLHFRFPTWFSSRVWTIAMRAATSGWDVNIRVFTQRPSAWPLFYHCESGRLDKVQQVLGCKQASIYDVDPFGLLPIHVSVLTTDISYDGTD
jgi:hypothetical protein